MRKLCIVLFSAVILVAPELLAQSISVEQITREPLEGLGSIGVLVEGLDSEGKVIGLSEEEIKAMVELRLRQNRIPIRDITDFTLESPYIYIQITVIYLEKIEHFMFSINVSIKQTVRLLRNNNTVVGATTWAKNMLQISHKDDARADIKSSIDTMLTFFINDYLAVNPVEGKG